MRLTGPYLLCPQPVLDFADEVELILETTGERHASPRIAEGLRGLLTNRRLSLEHLLPLSTAKKSYADGFRRHLLYRDTEERFSIQAIVWGPQQASPIHDHLAWCVAGLFQGEQQETIYQLLPDEKTRRLVSIESERKGPGDVTHFAAHRSNIHRVENVGRDFAVSIHVYGIDVQKVGSSVRRSYPLESVLA
jgi:predicted metal-dependent enzyme (double-stranded beta helix superfamily)